MKAPSILTIMMLMTVAIFAYAEASPRSGNREGASRFSRTSSAKHSCALGSHYSSFYGECRRTLLRVSN